MRTDYLDVIASGLPCREIKINGEPYLERYFLRKDDAGRQLWLHRFVSADPDRYFHCHPWNATSIVLAGGYIEHRMLPAPGHLTQLHATELSPGDRNVITMHTLHKIVSIEPGTWTLMIVEPGWRDYWGFLDNVTGEFNRVDKDYSEDWPWWLKHPDLRD